MKYPPANAGDMGSIPDPGRAHMPQSSSVHAQQLLRLCSGVQEPQPLKPAHPRAHPQQQEKSLQGGAQALHLESSPHLTQLKKSRAARKTQHSQK